MICHLMGNFLLESIIFFLFKIFKLCHVESTIKPIRLVKDFLFFKVMNTIQKTLIEVFNFSNFVKMKLLIQNFENTWTTTSKVRIVSHIMVI